MRKPILRSRGITVIEAIIITSIVLGLGVFLMLYSGGVFANTSLELTRQTDRNVQLLRNLLIIEAINYTETNGVEEARVFVRNIARYPIDLTITRIELLSQENVLYGIRPASGFGNLSKLSIGEGTGLDAPTCPACHKGDVLIYRVWYISSSSYNEENPLSSFNAMLYVEAKITKPIGPEKPVTCPIPQNNWVMVDFVDPITNADYGDMSSLGEVNIRPVLASRVEEDVPFTVTVRELEGGGSGSGSRAVDIPSINVVYVYGDYGGLTVPFEVTIASDWNVIQSEWKFGGIPRKLHVSGILLDWSRIDKKVETVILEIGVGDVGVYQVNLRLKDCYDNVLAEEFTIVTVGRQPEPGGEIYFETISLQEPVKLDQIYSLETEVVEVIGGGG